jgi:plastocyanin
MLFAAVSAALVAARYVSAADHYVTVGGPGKLLYDPEALFASPGDVVHFTFKQKNHTATQGSFKDPCSPLLDASNAPVFDTGYKFVADSAVDGFEVVDYHVQDDKPVWIHCAQTGHCGKGMVFAINCGADGAPNSFTNFKNSALAIGAAAAANPTPAAGGYPAPAGATTVIGGITVGPDPSQPTVTAVVSVGQSIWTTTYASYPNSPDPTPASIEGQVWVVKVGGSSLTYDPPSLKVKPRDKIQFVFQNKNHTITQSSFSNPCRKLEFTSATGQVGFDSGFQAVVEGTAVAALPMYEITVNTTDPIWAYCRQGNHCGSGMVFAANVDESSDRSLAAFTTLAKNINGTGAANSSTGTGGKSGAGQLVTGGLVGAIGTFIALFL